MEKRGDPAYHQMAIDHRKLGGSRKINLILGPGAARGFMHIGAVRALLDEGYEIRSIIGSSAGAFIALLYAKTHDIDEVERLIKGIGFKQLFIRPGKRVSIASLRLNTEAITRYFVDIFGRDDVTFEELDLPIAFTAINLLTRQVEFLHTGQILSALLASANLPFINPPLYIDGVPYIDGGLTLNMPHQIPKSFRRHEPYVGINVAFGERFRSGKVDFWRKAFVAGLGLWQHLVHKHQTHQSFQQAHEVMAPIAIEQIVPFAPQINRGDFDKLSLSIRLGYEAVALQLPAVNVSYEPRRHLHHLGQLKLHAAHA